MAGRPPRKRGGRGGRIYDEPYDDSYVGNTTARGRSSTGRGGRRGDREFSRGQRGRGRSDRGAHGSHRYQVVDGRSHDGATAQPNSDVKRVWDVDVLVKLAKVKGDKAISIIFNEQKAFFSLLSDHRTFGKVFKIRLIIEIIYNFTNSANLKSEQLITLLTQIFSDDYPEFLFNLGRAIRKMPSEISQKERDENFKVLGWLVHIFNQLLTICPQQSSSGLLPIADLQATGKSLEAQSSVKYSELVISINRLVQFNEDVKARIGKFQPDLSDTDDVAETESYRELSILPDLSEINAHSKPCLQPNIIEGCYSDWSHYLDVQFRLLREDFISPLWQGICDYNRDDVLRSRQNIRVYHHVHINEPMCLYSGVGFRLKFDTTHLQHINWEHSRRMIFGSLLCLSCDGFITVHFASIVKRDPKLLKEGYITIKFEGDTNGFEIDPQTEFTMVESTAYFEAYRHILCRLQKVEESPPPFKAYIVDCKPPTPLPPPSYLKGKPNICFDLSSLGILHLVKLLDACAWPHHENIDLDRSQLDAMHMALTQELSLIQGPPGTGKTYIGLKIVETLLQNKSIWDSHEFHDSNQTSPILVVCYTNHALDQFLEGILSFGMKDVRIVRVGGRSKSDKMEPYMLRNIIQRYHKTKNFLPRYHGMWASARNTMKSEQRDICRTMQEFYSMIEDDKPKLFSFHALENVMNRDHANQLRMMLCNL